MTLETPCGLDQRALSCGIESLFVPWFNVPATTHSTSHLDVPANDESNDAVPGRPGSCEQRLERAAVGGCRLTL